MPIRLLCLPLTLQVRAVLAVMLLQAPPGDWSGSFGRGRKVKWIYKCPRCDHAISLPEPVFGRDVPFCRKDRRHGRLEARPEA